MPRGNERGSVVLYRKYRPTRFSEVLGQDETVRALEGAIKLGRIAHAYLFAGSRGTGKTSVARIFASEIGTARDDLYEMDAASNRGIDDIRAIREGVSALPFSSRFKVYLVDEVHMLTKEAWNALLKTLEEPPAHVVFILATTELGKVPETAVSRCQLFRFRKPSAAVVREMVARVARAEGIALETSAAELIALLSEGSFRDAHGALEKVIALSAGRAVGIEEVRQVLGAPRASLVNDFLSALAARDASGGAAALAAAAAENIDMKVFLKLALQKFRFVLLLRFAPPVAEKFAEEFSADDLAFLRKLAGGRGDALTPDAMRTLLEADDALGRTALPELPLELALLRIAEGSGAENQPQNPRS